MTKIIKLELNVRTLTLLLSVLSMAVCHTLPAADLRTGAQDSSPKYYLEGTQMKGLCVDLIKAVERTDPTLKFTGYDRFVPLPRIEEGMASDPAAYDVFFGLIKSPAREAKFNFIDIPLYQTSLKLAARADDAIEVKSFDDIRKLGDEGSILAVRGTAHVAFLQQQGGLKIDAGANTTADDLIKLVNHRGRFVFNTNISLAHEIKRQKLEGKIRIIPATFHAEPQYLAVSKTLPPDTIAKLKSALARLESSGELSKIFSTYFH